MIECADRIVGVAALFRLAGTATALARRAFQRPRALVRAPHDRLIGFGDAGQTLRLHGRRRRQKPMAPAKGGIAVDPGAGRRGAHGRAIDQRQS